MGVVLVVWVRLLRVIDHCCGVFFFSFLPMCILDFSTNYLYYVGAKADVIEDFDINIISLSNCEVPLRAQCHFSFQKIK